MAGVAAGLVVSACLVWGCFNSDEVFEFTPSVASTDDPDPTVGNSTSASTTATDDTTGAPMGTKTCIDAIDCVRGCILDLAANSSLEPDLSCFLDCTQELSEQEALKLLRLGNCVSDQCAAQGHCKAPDDEGTTDGGSSSSDGGSSSSDGGSSSSDGGSSSSDDAGGSSEESGSSTSGADDGGGGEGGGGGGGGQPPIDPCLLCILNGMLDPEPEGCVEIARACRDKT